MRRIHTTLVAVRDRPNKAVKMARGRGFCAQRSTLPTCGTVATTTGTCAWSSLARHLSAAGLASPFVMSTGLSGVPAMAVMRWKKFCGFYQDLEGEHNSTYSTNCHLLTGDDAP